MEPEVVIAVPKGRVLEQLVPRLEAAGFDSKALTRGGRQLIRDDKVGRLRYLLLKPDDVPTWVEYGAADLGVVGRDVLLERQYDLFAPVDLGIGVCRMMVCGPADFAFTTDMSRTLRVASKFPNIARRHFLGRRQPVEVILVNGSVKLAPLTGLADVIIDIVETGETLRQNDLIPLEAICDISSVVVANRVGSKLKRAAIEPVLAALRASA